MNTSISNTRSAGTSAIVCRARSRIKFVMYIMYIMYIDCTYILFKKFKTTHHRKLMGCCAIRMTLLGNTISKFLRNSRDSELFYWTFCELLKLV
jgi:hypothetical protein